MTVTVDESTYGGSNRAELGVHVFIDVAGDGTADHEITAARAADGLKMDVALRELSGIASTADCQDLDGKSTAAATVDTAIANGLETFSFSFPTATVPGDLASFRWAAFGQSPPDAGQGGPWDYLVDAANPEAAAANPGDRRCGAAKGGLAVRLGAGTAFPDAQPEPSPTPTPSPGLPPARGARDREWTTRRREAGHARRVRVGAVARRDDPRLPMGLQRRRQRRHEHRHEPGRAPDPGDERPDGDRHGRRQRLPDRLGHDDDRSGRPRPRGCEAELNAGTLRARAACIRRAGDVYTLEPGAIAGSSTREVSVNGLTLSTTDPAGRVIVNRATGRMTSEGAFAIVISNTPIGDITLNRSGPEGISWRLPSDAEVHAAQVDFGDDETDPTNQDTGPVIRLVTFGAGEGCNNSERQRRACGELPGGFPLAGRIDVGFDTSNYQAVITANVAITTPFEVTGLVRLRVDLVEGFLLDTLGFGIGNVTMGPLLLERLAFVYSPPGRDPAHPTGDTWDVAVAVGIGTKPPLSIDGRIIFIAGRFNYGSADITLPVGIPIYAGVLLNRFAGVIGLDPTRIGGGIGISVIQLLQINTDFLYVDRSEGLAQLSGTGTIAISGINIGRAYIDYWTDGYFAFGGVLGYGYPSLAHPTVAISGATDFYIEAQPDGSYRSQGDGRLDVTVYFIHGVARMFFNNDWMAGCLPGPRRRPVRRPQPAHRRDAHSGDRL